MLCLSPRRAARHSARGAPAMCVMVVPAKNATYHISVHLDQTGKELWCKSRCNATLNVSNQADDDEADTDETEHANKRQRTMVTHERSHEA